MARTPKPDGRTQRRHATDAWSEISRLLIGEVRIGSDGKMESPSEAVLRPIREELDLSRLEIGELASHGNQAAVVAVRVLDALRFALTGGLGVTKSMTLLKAMDRLSQNYLRSVDFGGHIVNIDQNKTVTEIARQSVAHVRVRLVAGDNAEQAGLSLCLGLIDNDLRALPGMTPSEAFDHNRVRAEVEARLRAVRSSRGDEAQDIVRAVWRGWADAVGASFHDPFVGERVRQLRKRRAHASRRAD